MSDFPRTRRAQRTSKVALFVLWAAFASIAYNIYSEVAELALIDELEELAHAGREYSDDVIARIDANDERQRNARFGYLGAVLLSTILLMVFVSRTNRACRELGAKHMEFSPNWAWGYWLVPFLNLVRPFQIVRELWVTADENHDSSPLIGAWWVAWLATGAVARFGPQLGPNATLDDFREANHYFLASHALDIVAFGLTIALVAKLTGKLAGFKERTFSASVRVVNKRSD